MHVMTNEPWPRAAKSPLVKFSDQTCIDPWRDRSDRQAVEIDDSPAGVPGITGVVCEHDCRSDVACRVFRQKLVCEVLYLRICIWRIAPHLAAPFLFQSVLLLGEKNGGFNCLLRNGTRRRVKVYRAEHGTGCLDISAGSIPFVIARE